MTVDILTVYDLTMHELAAYLSSISTTTYTGVTHESAPEAHQPIQGEDMDTEQKVALDESIAHWRENETRYANAEFMHTDASNCACCQLQAKRAGCHVQDATCEGCVISVYTGQDCCDGTPYNHVTRKGENPAVMRKWLEDLRDGKNPEIWKP